MSAFLKPYSAYKDSGVEWLGRVPEHWEVRRLSAIGRLFKGNGGTKEDEVPTGVPCVRYGDVYMHHRFFVRETRACVPVERASDYTPIRHGDVLFAGSGETIEEIGKSVACLIESPACCGGDIVVFRPSVELDARFMGYATDSRPAVAQKSRMGRGITVMHIYGDQLRNLWLAYPPLPEQAAIACYLDYMDRRIRRYVRAKQKLIKLLEEQKQVIIHRAVTGQIDVRTGNPYPAYKDSGVEWLGEVPEHWMVRRIKDVARLKSGDGITSADIEPVNSSGRRNSSPSRCCDDPLNPAPVGAYAVYGGNGVRGFTSQYTHDGDFVLIGRQGALCGNINYASGRFWASEHAVVAHPRGEFNLVWFGELLRTMNLNRYSIAAAQPGLAVERIQDLPLPVPPVEEQTRIGRYLDVFASEIDEAVQCARRGIDLLREYRTRLIADVVTGKLDVREAAANLPDEAEEPEPLADEDLLTGESEVDDQGQEEAALEEIEA